ncbi:MAG: hypothetical protein RMZ41_010690 [Nostoc sp. DedVER02]|uniref:hypothetical protein n=1 Tax=unclassified Nostoc TaxID=2593658 RepID=UPI002AD2660A|nr:MULTISPECIES: hypothetical protein [unclassified Nostoc]MDZ7986295.1 hypothetical protein [Nostoc sp. DedVER02]MDZ8112685.1 hypothetical protein [Nostoc sp. DedVER01b]
MESAITFDYSTNVLNSPAIKKFLGEVLAIVVEEEMPLKDRMAKPQRGRDIPLIIT